MEIWIITSGNLGSRPIIVSSSKEEATKQLFDYMGYEGKDNDNVIYEGFKEYKYNEEENETSCIGEYKFQTCYTTYVPKRWEKDEYYLYQLTLDQKQKLS